MHRSKVAFIKVGLLMLLSSTLMATEQNSRFIPKSNESFLLGEYKPQAPALIMLSDPFCSYCIRAFKKRAQLENYNLYVYWAPILSEDSVRRVTAFFRCETPIDQQVLNALLDYDVPLCIGEVKRALKEENDVVVAHLDPKTVPQYWLNGRQVRWAQLNLVKSVATARALANEQEISVDWTRYRLFAVNKSEAYRQTIAIVLPEGRSAGARLLKSLYKSTRYNWYLISSAKDARELAQLRCSAQAHDCGSVSRVTQYAELKMEFQLLIGVEELDGPAFLLNGKRLNQKEINYLIPKLVQKIIF